MTIKLIFTIISKIKFSNISYIFSWINIRWKTMPNRQIPNKPLKYLQMDRGFSSRRISKTSGVYYTEMYSMLLVSVSRWSKKWQTINIAFQPLHLKVVSIVLFLWTVSKCFLIQDISSILHLIYLSSTALFSWWSHWR